jgi:hypothetical protein
MKPPCGGLRERTGRNVDPAGNQHRTSRGRRDPVDHPAQERPEWMIDGIVSGQASDDGLARHAGLEAKGRTLNLVSHQADFSSLMMACIQLRQDCARRVELNSAWDGDPRNRARIVLLLGLRRIHNRHWGWPRHVVWSF